MVDELVESFDLFLFITAFLLHVLDVTVQLALLQTHASVTSHNLAASNMEM